MIKHGPNMRKGLLKGFCWDSDQAVFVNPTGNNPYCSRIFIITKKILTLPIFFLGQKQKAKMERTWLKLLSFLADSDQKLNLKGRKLKSQFSICLAQLWNARSTDPNMEGHNSPILTYWATEIMLDKTFIIR